MLYTQSHTISFATAGWLTSPQWAALQRMLLCVKEMAVTRGQKAAAGAPEPRLDRLQRLKLSEVDV